MSEFLYPLLIVIFSTAIAVFYYTVFSGIKKDLLACKNCLKKSESFTNSVIYLLILTKKDAVPLADKIQETIDSSLEINGKTYTMNPLSEIWSRDSILSNRINTNLLESIPNIIVGVGLTVTFFLLAVILGDAGGALSSNSSQSIQNLLNNASSKFWISVAALACSIGFGIFIKTNYKSVQNSIDDVLLHLRKSGLDHFGAEQSIVVQLELMKQIATANVVTANQTNWHDVNFFESMASSIDRATAPALKFQALQTQNLLGEIKQAVIDLNESNASNITALKTEINEINKSAMRKMIDDFRHSLTAASSTEIQTFQKVMRDLSQELNQACQRLVVALPEATNTCTNTLQNYTTSWVAQLERTTQQHNTQLSALSEQIGHNMQATQVSSDRVAATYTTLMQMVDLTDQALESSQHVLKSTHAGLLETISELQPIFKETKQNLSELNQLVVPASEQMLDTFEGASSAIVDVSEHLSLITNAVSQLSKQLSSLAPLNDSMARLKEDQYDFLESHIKEITSQTALMTNVLIEIKQVASNLQSVSVKKTDELLSLSKLPEKKSIANISRFGGSK